MSQNIPLKIRAVAAAGTVLVLAACATPPPPPPPPPPSPPPPVEVIPLRPIPPGGASYAMSIPPVGPDGQRLTVNSGLSDDETVWHFRSAWNVAALNCLGPQYQPILDGYSEYIKKHARPLKAANDRIDKVYRDNYPGRTDAIRARETRMTTVYNFFALPPARAEFCTTALGIAQQALALDEYDPVAFAKTNLPAMRTPFENFFNAYAQYQTESAAWDARYGERYGASQPGYVAVQEARMRNGTAVPVAGESDPVQTISLPPSDVASATDPVTGAKIPVVPVDETRTATPVVQPVPDDEDGAQ